MNTSIFVIYCSYINDLLNFGLSMNVCYLFLSLFSCMDASIAIKPVFDRFQSVIITSGVSVCCMLIR